MRVLALNVGAIAVGLAAIACDGDETTANGTPSGTEPAAANEAAPAGSSPGATETADADATPPASPTGGIRACGSEPLPPCGPFGQPVSLLVDSPMPAFPPRPDARIAAFPGEEVEVVMEGFAADEAAQLLSTHEGYDGSRYQAESNGEIRFTVRLDGSGGERAHYFVMVQEQPAAAEPRLAAFILANIGEDAVEGAQEVIREAVFGPEGTETGPCPRTPSTAASTSEQRLAPAVE